MNFYRVILTDAHSMFRHGIKTIIEEASDIKVAGEARDGLKLIELEKNYCRI